MQYGDKIIYVEGVITRVTHGSIEVDFKGRLGHISVPLRMVITDYPLEVGQEVALNMSFLEVLSPEVNEKYRSNIDRNIDRNINDKEV